MMYTSMSKSFMMTSHGASASQAEASFCARSAAANTVLSVDAIIMASILIICGLVCLLVLGISVLVLGLVILLAVLLIGNFRHTPRKRTRAYC